MCVRGTKDLFFSSSLNVRVARELVFIAGIKKNLEDLNEDCEKKR